VTEYTIFPMFHLCVQKYKLKTSFCNIGAQVTCAADIIVHHCNMFLLLNNLICWYHKVIHQYVHLARCAKNDGMV
jgi:hypothetical protein